MAKNLWDTTEESIRSEENYPPVEVHLSILDIAKLNTQKPVIKQVFLSDGKELVVNVILNTDRDSFAEDFKEVLKNEDRD
jgi:hypothetical protein